MTTTLAALQSQREKFSAERAQVGGITYMTLSGTMNVEFVGKQAAKWIKTGKIVINMRETRRFASWGMSEWMEFLRLNADRDVYIVECSAYALSQLNLITGLLGHAKLVSYYAPFRCGQCNAELEARFIIPRDRDTIRHLPATHHDCPHCGGRAALEEYPAAFFDAIADRPAFDIDDEVLAFMRARLGYDIEPDVTRFRAYRATQNGYTYLRLSGNVGALPAPVLANATDGTAVIDLDGIVFDPDAPDVGEWRSYVKTASTKASSLQLLGCPFPFLERAVRTDDFRDKIKVRTFTLSYDCAHCEKTSTHTIDVADNLEYLAEGTPPTVTCPTCRASLVAALSASQAMFLRTLPARDRDPGLDKFLGKVRTLPTDKLQNCLSPRTADAAATETPSGKLPLVIGLATTVVAALGVVAFVLWRDRSEARANTVGPTTGSGEPQAPTFVRPDWVLSIVPSSAYCHDVINRLMCVGVSSFKDTPESGVDEASNAALEELVNSVGLRLTDPYFKQTVIPLYAEVRAKALATLQTAELERKKPEGAAAFTSANDAVRSARQRVVEVFKATGGAAVPTQRTDWHWERYASDPGEAPETLVFVRYDINLDAIRALVETYSTSTTQKDLTTITAFPSLAWRFPEFSGGAMVTKAEGSMTAAGLQRDQVITSVGEQRVGDATTFTRRLEEARAAKAPFMLTTTTSDGSAKSIALKR